MNRKRTAAILFGGIGGFSAGLKRSMVEAYGGVHTEVWVLHEWIPAVVQ